MSAGFTKGPWDWWDDGNGPVLITEAAEQKFVAQTTLPSNARLIAAAPELYEALDGLLPCVGSPVPLKDTAERVRRAVSALSRARGDQ